MYEVASVSPAVDVVQHARSLRVMVWETKQWTASEKVRSKMYFQHLLLKQHRWYIWKIHEKEMSSASFTQRLLKPCGQKQLKEKQQEKMSKSSQFYLCLVKITTSQRVFYFFTVYKTLCP